LIGEGNAYWVRDILEKLMKYNIDYETVPPYCHKIHGILPKTEK